MSNLYSTFLMFGLLVGALDFHHIDPTKKEFAISKLKAYSFYKLKPELDKCVLLCKNCHAEYHAGIATFEIGGPSQARTESLASYEEGIFSPV